MEELEKVLNTWRHVIARDDKGELTVGMRTLIIKTIGLIEELKKKREAK